MFSLYASDTGAQCHLLLCGATLPLLLVSLTLLDHMRAWAQHQDAYYEGQQQRQAELPTPCHPDWQWLCEDGLQCIAQYDVCDGIAQCVDHSDEKSCGNRNRLPPHREIGEPVRQLPHPLPAPQQSPQGTPSSTTKLPTPSVPATKSVEQLGQRQRAMEYLLLGLAAFTILAGAVHWAIRQRRKVAQSYGGARGFRKGESLVDDEDDLLISQMYT